MAPFALLLYMLITGKIIPGYMLDRVTADEYEIIPGLPPPESPQPGVPTICMIDHRHTADCPGVRRVYGGFNSPTIFEVAPAPDPFVPFDEDLADIEVIQPVMLDGELKWRLFDGGG